MFDNFSKVYVSVEDLAVRIMLVNPDRLLFMFDECILIFLKSDSFYLPSVKTPKMAANPLKKTEIRRYTTEIPAFRPFFQRYGWTLCKWFINFLHGVISLPDATSYDKYNYLRVVRTSYNGGLQVCGLLSHTHSMTILAVIYVELIPAMNADLQKLLKYR